MGEGYNQINYRERKCNSKNMKRNAGAFFLHTTLHTTN